MNSSIYRILLDIQRASSQKEVVMKRMDSKRTLYIILTDGGVPYRISDGCRAFFVAEKPDGHKVFNPCVIDRGIIIYDVTPQTTAAVGRCRCEIQLYDDNGGLITCPTFHILVDGTVYGDGEFIESTDEFNALSDLIAEVTKLKEDMIEGIVEEKDPTVPDWAKQQKKPDYTAEEVGADPTGTATNTVNAHNTDKESHADLRLQFEELLTRVNTVLDSDDITLDQMSEMVAYIKSNKDLIDAITASKVNVTDIVDNLLTNVSNKPLSAAQGVVLKGLIDGLMSGKVDTAKLNEAINSALTQAKESGEFDGEDGTIWHAGTFISGTGTNINMPIIGAKTGDFYLNTSTGELYESTEGGVFWKFLYKMSGGDPDLSGYAKKEEIPKSAADVGADPSGTAAKKVSEHNAATDTHNDIRLLIEGLTTRLNALANSDDTTLDQMLEVVAYIKSNKSLIDAITTSKVSVSDIVDDLTTSVANKPLSAKQGVALKALIDAIIVPTKTSQLQNDSNFVNKTEVSSEVSTALAQAKNSGEFDGKSAYEYAKDGGYTGTEQEFGEQLAFLMGYSVFGHVDENNHVVLTGNISDGSILKFEMEDGTTIVIGEAQFYCQVTNNLSNCTNRNTATETAKGKGYTATITANSGYELKSVTVTMGGSPVTVNGGTINIEEVTGDIVITAVAEAANVATNFAKPLTVGRLSNSSVGNVATDTTNRRVTEFVPVMEGDLVRISGLDNSNSVSTSVIMTFNSSKTKVDNLLTICTETSNTNIEKVESTTDGATFEVITSNIAYVRFSGIPADGNEDNIVVNIKRNGVWLTDTVSPEPTNLFAVGGDGYIESGRCSSTGADRTDTTTCFVTNYIDVSYGDTIYIKSYQTPTAENAYSGIKYTDGTTGGFMLETDTTIVKDFSLANGITQFTVNAENADYMRFTILKHSSLDDIIINVKRNGEWL